MKTPSLILQGYRLTTAEILYRMPDQPRLLQTYVWQEYDLAPRFPRLHKFLRFWQDNLDGPLHSVRIAAASGDFGMKADYRHASFAEHLH